MIECGTITGIDKPGEPRSVFLCSLAAQGGHIPGCLRAPIPRSCPFSSRRYPRIAVPAPSIHSFCPLKAYCCVILARVCGLAPRSPSPRRPAPSERLLLPHPESGRVCTAHTSSFLPSSNLLTIPSSHYCIERKRQSIAAAWHSSYQGILIRNRASLALDAYVSACSSLAVSVGTNHHCWAKTDGRAPLLLTDVAPNW